MNKPINDLIFKELIKRGYSLDGKTRVWNIADSKLWYLTPEQAKAYLDLENSKDYSGRMFETEIHMLKEFMPEISEKVLNGSAVNIIDIGCGDGKKAVPVIEVLHKQVKLRYCPIDISGYMVNHAIQKIKKLNKGEVVEFKYNISDFDNLENVSSLLTDGEFRQNFFIFLGNTIGNFEMHEVMYEVVEAMDSREDFLLIGVALANGSQKELLKSYKHKFNDDFFRLMMYQLGFSPEDIEMDVRFQNSRIELFYNVKKNKTVSLGDKSINFIKGDQMLIGISHRYTEKELLDALSLYFKNCELFLNKDKSWALVLCKKS
jgi:uncharacterized SAM-dependent methyltransferase